MGGPERRFIVGFKNQQRLKEKFQSIAYTCRMADIADRLKLPPVLPDTERMVDLPTRDMKASRELAKEFIADCGTGTIVVSNVLSKMLRLQQIAAGFCMVQEDIEGPSEIQELNTAKEDALADMLEDISPEASVVVFCVFVHDLECVARSAAKAKRRAFEVSGRRNDLSAWKENPGAVLAVQIQAGSEGIDMTNANYAIYYSLPHSLAQYNQSRARLYRPGQTRPVSFCHLLAQDTIDEAMYASLRNKHDVIESIRAGEFDFGYIK
jgi:SNF2 family DNA or RNA helicase